MISCILYILCDVYLIYDAYRLMLSIPRSVASQAAMVAVSASLGKRTAPRLFSLGCLCFSGSIYGLVLLPKGHGLRKVLGPVTPLGGLLFIAAWLSMCFGARPLAKTASAWSRQESDDGPEVAGGKKTLHGEPSKKLHRCCRATASSARLCRATQRPLNL